MFEEMVKDAFKNLFQEIKDKHTEEINKLKREVTAAEINAAKLGNKLNMANAALAAYEATDKIVEDNYQEYAIQIEGLKDTIANLESANESHQKYNGELRVELEAEKAQASQEHMLHLNIVGEKMEEIKMLRTIRDAQKDRILELIEERDLAKKSFDLSFHGKIMNTQANRIKELETYSQSLAQRNDDLQSRLHPVYENNLSLGIQIHGLQDTIAALKADNRRLQNHLNEMLYRPV